MRIWIKSFFSEWVEVDRVKAKKYVHNLKSRITNISEGNKNDYINANKLKGVTVEELENE